MKGASKLLGLDWIYSENSTYDSQKDEYEETGKLVNGVLQPDNNGNLRMEKLAHNVGTALSVDRSYGFDTANRVVSYTEPGIGHAYGFDGFGNVWQTAGTPGLRANNRDWYLQAGGTVNNQLNNTLVPYDSAGNQEQLSAQAGTTAKYDGEGRVWSVELSGTPVSESEYDAEGRRVKRVANGSTTWLMYGADGKLLAEYGGTAVAAGTQYLVQDYLGSTRLMLDGVGGCVERVDYAPFGAKVPRAGATCYGTAGASGKPLFTGKFRDDETSAGTETGLDHFEARYFSGAQGRFTSPDQPFADQHVEDPQSWNLYA